MSSHVGVMVLRTDGSVEYGVLVNSLEALQALVGGNIEFLPLRHEDFHGDAPAHGYCNEEGKLEGLEPNLIATMLFRAFGCLPDDDVIVGDVVVLGDDPDSPGDEGDCPLWVQVALTATGMVLARNMD